MKRLTALVAAAALMSTLAVAGTASAEVNAVTPSTNDANRDAGWAHVNVTPATGSADLEFVSTRAFASCFEYRTDGD